MAKAILQFVLGALAGLVTMFFVIGGIEWVGQRIYPPPAGLNPHVPEQMGQILALSPVAALAIVVVAWIAGSFAGGWVAAMVSRAWPRSAATVVGAGVMLAVCAMIFMMPGHPTWMAILGLVLPVPAALSGARLARPRLRAASTVS